MELLQVVALGIVQALTEFLPDLQFGPPDPGTLALEERRAPTTWQRIERLAAHTGERLGLYVLRGDHGELVAILRTRDGLHRGYTVLDLEHTLDASVRFDLPLLVEVALLPSPTGPPQL